MSIFDQVVTCLAMTQLAEIQHVHLQMIRVPVTVDGGLKNQFVETNVGFDTTCKAYMFGL
jgi:6-phosphofructokinase